MRRLLLLAGLLTCALLGVLLPAAASWTADGSGPAAVQSTTVNAGNTPSVGVAGDVVSLVWEPSTLATSVPVTGYQVKRYDATGTVAQVVASGSCAQTVAALECSETSVPNGTWTYSITPVHDNWRGTESPTSAVRVAASPSTAVTFPAVGTSYHLAGFTGGCGTASSGDLCGTVVDPGSGITKVAVSLQRGSGAYWDGSGFTSSSEVYLDATGTTNWSYAFDPAAFPADGRYTLRVQAVDGAGVVGEASSTFIVDRTAPVAPTIDSGPPSPSGSAAASFGFSNTEAGAAFECRLDGSAWAGCTSPNSYSGLANGSHTFEVRSVDAAGNIGNGSSHTWVVDTVAPSAAITFPANGSFYSDFNAGCGTSTGDVCGTSSDTGGTGVDQVQVSLQQGSGSYWNGTGFASAGEVLLSATGTTNWSQAFSASSLPADGQYTLRARITDAAGNTTTSSSTFTLDRTAPVAPTITSAPPSPSSSAAASFGFSNTEAGVGFECRLDGSAWAGCTSPRSYSGLANGSHTFEVRSVDAAGNIGNGRSHTWVVDTVAPSAAITFPANGSSHASGGTTNNFNAGCGTSTGDVCGTSSDTGGTGVNQVQVSLQQGSGSYWNGTGFASASEVLLSATGTTNWSQAFSAANFPADGQYTLRARITDKAGNNTLTSSTFSVDVTAPRGLDVQTANVAGGAAGELDTKGGDSVTFTYSETIAPGSVLANWAGASTNVTVRVHQGAAGANDSLTIWTENSSAQLPLGVLDLGRADYSDKDFTYSSSQMTQTGADIKIVLGARSGGAANPFAKGTGTMVWTPAAGYTDLLGNAGTTTAVTESGAADTEF